MKKLLIVLAFLLIGISNSFSAELFKLTSINAKSTNGNWEGWRTCDILSKLDLDDKTLTIYSYKIQIFHLNKLQCYFNDKCRSYCGYAKDDLNKLVYVNISIYSTGDITLNFKYIEGEYKYTAVFTEIN